MQLELGYSTAQLTGAYSLALAVSALAGVVVGRHLDRHSPRALMTLGSIAGAALVVAWSQVHGLLAFYAVWLAIGIVMAAVLYEPAFTVLAKHFTAAPERRRHRAVTGEDRPSQTTIGRDAYFKTRHSADARSVTAAQ
jgi:MFS family permease